MQLQQYTIKIDKITTTAVADVTSAMYIGLFFSNEDLSKAMLWQRKYVELLEKNQKEK